MKLDLLPEDFLCSGPPSVSNSLVIGLLLKSLAISFQSFLIL